MKFSQYLILVALVTGACQTEPSKTASSEMEMDNIDGKKTLVVPWTVQIDGVTHELKIEKDPAANMANLEPVDIVDAINLKYPEIKLEWVKSEGSKAFVRIADASYLTQQSGSEGAQAYLAEVTYSLTEFKSITAVDFEFKEGDHAQPGVYKRTNFIF